MFFNVHVELRFFFQSYLSWLCSFMRQQVCVYNLIFQVIQFVWLWRGYNKTSIFWFSHFANFNFCLHVQLQAALLYVYTFELHITVQASTL